MITRTRTCIWEAACYEFSSNNLSFEKRLNLEFADKCFPPKAVSICGTYCAPLLIILSQPTCLVPCDIIIFTCFRLECAAFPFLTSCRNLGPFKLERCWFAHSRQDAARYQNLECEYHTSQLSDKGGIFWMTSNLISRVSVEQTTDSLCTFGPVFNTPVFNSDFLTLHQSLVNGLDTINCQLKSLGTGVCAVPAWPMNTVCNTLRRTPRQDYSYDTAIPFFLLVLLFPNPTRKIDNCVDKNKELLFRGCIGQEWWCFSRAHRLGLFRLWKRCKLAAKGTALEVWHYLMVDAATIQTM